MSTVKYYGVLMTVLLLHLDQNSEGATLTNGSLSVEDRKAQCNSYHALSMYPQQSDPRAKCTHEYSNKPTYYGGPAREIGELLLELKCDRLTCFRVTLLYDHRGNQYDCTYSRNFRRIGESFYMVCNGYQRISNLSPGNYCIHHIEYDWRENDKSKMCSSEVHKTPMLELLPKPTAPAPIIPVPDPDNMPASIYINDYSPTQRLPDSPTQRLVVVYIILPIVFVLLAVGVLYVYKRRCWKGTKFAPSGVPKPIPSVTMSEAIEMSPLLNIFFIYSRDCPHHQTVVEKLAEFFVANKCKVAYSGWDIEEIAKNKVGWVSEKLNGNYKVVLVASKKCFERQQSWLQNQTRMGRPRDTHEESLFIQAIAMIMYRIDQAFDYNKIFVVRPSYVSSDCIPSNICPGRHYVIPDRVAELLCHLHNIDTKCVKLDQFQLEQWSHCMAPFIAVRDSIDEIASGNIKCESCSQPNYGYITV